MELYSIIQKLFVSLFLYVICASIALVHISNNFSIKNKKYLQWYFYFLLLNVMIYCQSGDFWTSRLWFIDPIYRANDTHQEEFYRIIVKCIPSIFLLYRFVVWGTGVFLFKKICNRFNINFLCAMSLFAILYVEHYSYARASLGIMTAIWGYSLICDTSISRNRLYYFKLLGIILLSCAMHKSILGLWAILLCAHNLRFNAITLILMILLYEPVVFVFNTYLIPSIVHFVELNDADLNTNYISGTFTERNLSGLPRYYSASLLLLGYSYMKLFRKKLPSHIEHFVMATISIFYVASLFLSLKMGNSNTTALRFFLMAFPTALITCTYAIQKKDVSKVVIFFILLWGAFYSTYLFYKNIIDPDYLTYTYCRANGLI